MLRLGDRMVSSYFSTFTIAYAMAPWDKAFSGSKTEVQVPPGQSIVQKNFTSSFELPLEI